MTASLHSLGFPLLPNFNAAGCLALTSVGDLRLPVVRSSSYKYKLFVYAIMRSYNVKHSANQWWIQRGVGGGSRGDPPSLQRLCQPFCPSLKCLSSPSFVRLLLLPLPKRWKENLVPALFFSPYLIPPPLPVQMKEPHPQSRHLAPLLVLIHTQNFQPALVFRAATNVMSGHFTRTSKGSAASVIFSNFLHI